LLDIAGDGMMKKTLQEMTLAYGLGECVTFLGAKPSSWLAEHAPAYRAFIAAFRKGRDGSKDTSPIVLKEAMAMALPIVTTRFIDIPELVGNECALLCPVSSPQGLAEAVLQLENLPLEKLQHMGYAGRRRVEQNYTVRHQVANISNILGL
jgi:glycosyltransferase involved in cell wall biosynthesis